MSWFMSAAANVLRAVVPAAVLAAAAAPDAAAAPPAPPRAPAGGPRDAPPPVPPDGQAGSGGDVVGAPRARSGAPELGASPGGREAARAKRGAVAAARKAEVEDAAGAVLEADASTALAGASRPAPAGASRAAQCGAAAPPRGAAALAPRDSGAAAAAALLPAPPRLPRERPAPLPPRPDGAAPMTVDEAHAAAMYARMLPARQAAWDKEAAAARRSKARSERAVASQLHEAGTAAHGIAQACIVDACSASAVAGAAMLAHLRSAHSDVMRALRADELPGAGEAFQVDEVHPSYEGACARLERLSYAAQCVMIASGGSGSADAALQHGENGERGRRVLFRCRCRGNVRGLARAVIARSRAPEHSRADALLSSDVTRERSARQGHAESPPSSQTQLNCPAAATIVVTHGNAGAAAGAGAAVGGHVTRAVLTMASLHTWHGPDQRRSARRSCTWSRSAARGTRAT